MEDIKEKYDKKVSKKNTKKIDHMIQKAMNKWLNLENTARGYVGVNDKKANKLFVKAEGARIACLSLSYSADAQRR